MNDRAPTLHETLACVLAREFVDEEVGFTGLLTGSAAAIFGTAIPLVAMELARLTHAPNLTILLAGCYHNPDFRDLEALPDSEHSAMLRDLPQEATMVNYPGPWVLKRGDIDFGFSSGVQVDRQGNLNSVCVGPHDRPKVRLVGPILQPEHMTLFSREYVMMPYHDRRNFVEKVDYVSGVGYPAGIEGRRRLGLDHGGPALVVTPRCVFDFDRDEGRMKVRSIHAGVTPESLRAATGFELGDLSWIPTTPPPTAEELRLIRTQVDPRRLLLRPVAAA
jgi:glutaconate CoA-transferase subunit B